MTLRALVDRRESSATVAEIRSQPALWQRLIVDLDERLRPLASSLAASDRVLFLGCGSSYIGGQLGAHLLRTHADRPAVGYVASEYVYFGESLERDLRDTTAVAVSRSGETSETLEAVERFRANGGRNVVVLTCRPSSTLAGQADAAVAFPEADETSVAQTRSVSSFWLALTRLTEQAAGRHGDSELPRIAALVSEYLDDWQQRAARLFAEHRWSRLVYLGTGPQYWVAREAALKAAEMSLRDADAFRFLEFRHGPKATLRLSTLVVGLTHPSRAAAEMAALDELRPMAGGVLDLRQWAGVIGQPVDLYGLLLDVVLVQLLAVELALSLGEDPDSPPTLASHVELDLLRAG